MPVAFECLCAFLFGVHDENADEVISHGDDRALAWVPDISNMGLAGIHEMSPHVSHVGRDV